MKGEENNKAEEDPELLKEQEAEAAYQDLLLKYKEQFGLISEEELEQIKAKKKKRK